MPIASKFGSWAMPIVAKTGNYTCVTADSGTFFTNEGAAGGVTFTLPTNAADHKGWFAEFFTVAAQVLTVASSPTDKLVVHADAAADTIATAATIGQHFTVRSLGATGYLVVSDPSAANAATAVTAVTIVT